LRHLQAIDISKGNEDQILVSLNLEWPTEITEQEFFRKLKSLPKAKTHTFLQ
jgi:hypothetical protein